MEIIDTPIAGVRLLRPAVHTDRRGAFFESYNKARLAEAGIDVDFVQDNHARSRQSGTVRGLHFQAPPMAQAKLVRVVRGAIFAVALDLRGGSPTYGSHAEARLSAENGDQLFLPEGMAHGYCTLEPDTEIIYKVSAYYSPEHEGGVLWNDPALAIPWPVSAADAVVGERDMDLPPLADLGQVFSLA